MQSASANTSWIASIADPTLQSQVATDLAGGAFTYSEIVSLLNGVASRGAVTAAEFSSLQTIAANLNNGAQISDYLASEFVQLVDGSPENATWTGGAATSATLGNLAVGTTTVQINELIGKWFLGTDMPTATVGSTNYAYQTFALPLYGASGGPSALDVVQGQTGDCVVLSTILTQVANNPNAIKSMIVDDGNGVYGVRFFINGNETWVTVNNQLPVYSWGGVVYNGNGTTTPPDLWVSLIEKGYAELSSGGLIGHPAVNSYANISGNASSTVLQAVTGCTTTKYYESGNANWNAYKPIIVAAIQSGDDVVIGSSGNTTNASGQTLFVADHAFAVMGYDAATGDFIIRNPWGSYASVVGQFECSMSDIAAVNGDFCVSNTAHTTVALHVDPVQALTSTPTSLAGMFKAVSTTGAPITQYMFELAGAGALNLNGAVNLATAAQTAQGQIVVSGADLAKLTYDGSSASGAQDLLAWAYDGATWSPVADISLNVSTTSALKVQHDVVVGAGKTIALSAAFMGVGAAALTTGLYQIAPMSGGTINLNGATPWSSNASTGQIDIYARDFAKLTWTAPTTTGPATFDVWYASSSWGSEQTVSVYVGESAAAAIQDYDNGLYANVSAVYDSAANIFANLDALQTMFASGHTQAIGLSDVTSASETLAASQFIADMGVLSIAQGSFSLNVTGMTAIQATGLNSAVAQPMTLNVTDTASNVAADLDQLHALSNLASIALTDATPVLQLTAAQLASDASALNKIANSAYDVFIAGGSQPQTDYHYVNHVLSTATFNANANASTWGWSSYVNRYDGAGNQVVEQTIAWTNGSGWDDLYSGGVLTSQTFNANGNASAWGWTTYVNHYNSAGNEVVEQTGAWTGGAGWDNVYAGGVLTSQTFYANANAAIWGWTSCVNTYNSAGNQVVEQIGAWTNGAGWDNRYSGGVLTSQAINANGNASALGWTSYVNRYNSAGNQVVEQTGSSTNGAGWDNLYSGGVLTSQTINANANASAWGYSQQQNRYDSSANLLSSADYDASGALKLYRVERATDVDTLSGLAANGSWVIDLLNGAGGFSSAVQAVNALHSDGAGGAMLSLGSSGSVDFAGLAPNQISAAHFKIG